MPFVFNYIHSLRALYACLPMEIRFSECILNWYGDCLTIVMSIHVWCEVWCSLGILQGESVTTSQTSEAYSLVRVMKKIVWKGV